MQMVDSEDSSDFIRLIRQAADGDDHAMSTLFSGQREHLLRMVSLRMDRRLRGRIDPSDVIQEAFLVAARELPAYAANPAISFYAWLRWITGQRLIDQHRRHLGAQGRAVNREVSIYQGSFPEATNADLAAHLSARLSSPSQAAMRIERELQLQQALQSLEPLEREILALRHFEGLSNGAAAEILGLDKSATSKRYARALVKLKNVLIVTFGSAFNSDCD